MTAYVLVIPTVTVYESRVISLKTNDALVDFIPTNKTPTVTDFKTDTLAKQAILTGENTHKNLN